jgi:hypothetical protein
MKVKNKPHLTRLENPEQPVKKNQKNSGKTASVFEQ